MPKVTYEIASMHDHVLNQIVDGLISGIVTQAEILLALHQATAPDQAVIAEARNLFAGDDLEIDDFPLISEAETGTWVSAWIWVPTPEIDEEADPVPAANAPIGR